MAGQRKSASTSIPHFPPDFQYAFRESPVRMKERKKTPALMQNIIIRIAEEKDIPALYGVEAAMKSSHGEKYFERCFAEGKRTVIVAVAGEEMLGYVLLNWEPTYPPFRRLGIPEIQDLNVIPPARKQGIGNSLVDWCEAHAKKSGKEEIAISVGLYAAYGPAQRIYARRGYVPDGAGIAYDDVPVAPGEMRAVDDLLTMKMLKNLT